MTRLHLNTNRILQVPPQCSLIMGERDGSLALEGTPPSTALPAGQESATTPIQSNIAVYTDTTHNDTTHSDLAFRNTAAVSHNAELPVVGPLGLAPSLPVLASRPHIRTPSAAGLQLQTDLPLYATTAPRESPNTPTIVESRAEGYLRFSATAPIAIQGGNLRTALSTASMTSSLSPGSALSSPALNALTDITPLPSPLVVSDSPGPWMRARPGSRGSTSVTRDDSLMLSNGTLSPSPSKKKGYQGLMSAAVEAAAANMQTHQKNVSGHTRNRSMSEFVPEVIHNVRPRHVTISNVAPGQVPLEPHLHREEYLAAQRGLLHVPAIAPASLPTPPASNRSVTESEEEETQEEESNIEYLSVRQGPQNQKKLWRPVRQLGQGAFSKVFLATSEKLTAKDPLDEATLNPRKLVAIKVVEHGPAGGADEERVELSLKREVEMLRSVSHPSLVHLRAFDHDDSQALLVLTYCAGGDLFEIASEHRDLLSADLVQRIFAELVGAIRYLHTQLIVHRDIKLESTFLCSRFGIQPSRNG